MAAALRASALVPDGHRVPASRPKRASTRFRELIADRPFVFAPGVYDPMTAELAMYHRFDAIYFSGYSFAVGYLGTTDMDLYSSVEIADGARRTVQALRKFQLTMAVGDPGAGIPPARTVERAADASILRIRTFTPLPPPAAGRPTRPAPPGRTAFPGTRCTLSRRVPR